MNFPSLNPSKIIFPKKINISLSNINNHNIIFNQSDAYKHISGIFHIDNSIEIKLPKTPNLEILNAVISHELIHRKQNDLTQGKYTKWIESYGNELNNCVKKFNNNENQDYAKIKNMHIFYKYGNPFEQMAYAYHFVKLKKYYNFKTPDDIIKYLKTSLIPINEIEYYINEYWKCL